MRPWPMLVFLCACGAPPLHVAVDVVTPIDPSTIASIDFETLAADGKVLSTKTSTSSKGVLSSVNFAPPKGVTFATLHATARDANRNTLGVGQTQLDFSKAGKSEATVYVSSPKAITFSAHPRASAQHRFHSSVIATSDGTVWIVGGKDEAGRLLTGVEAYNPYTLTFTNELNLDYACLDPTLTITTFSTNEVVIVSGGTDLTGAACNSLQAFEPAGVNQAGGGKTALVTMLEARANGFALALPEKALAIIFGGSAATSALGLQIGADVTAPSGIGLSVVSFSTTTNFVLDPKRSYGAALLADPTTAYFAGDSLTITKYDVGSGTQTSAATFTTPRSSPATVVAGARSLYVLAGGSPAIERWTVGGTVGPPVAQLAGNPSQPQAVEVPGPKLVVSGGLDASNTPLTSVWSYDLSNEQKGVDITGINLLVPRAGHRMIVTATNTLLVVGGSASDPSSEIYSLP